MGRKAGKPDFGHPPRDYGYSLIQNLKDAGCTDELIEEFRTLEEHAAVSYTHLGRIMIRC